MLKEIIINGILPLSISIVVALITIRLSVRVERRKMVNELRRKVYFDALRCLSSILKDPTIIFSEEFYNELEDRSLELEVYSAPSIFNQFSAIFYDIEDRMNEYRMEFGSEDAEEAFEYLPEDIRDEMKDNMAFNYMIYQMPDTSQIEQMCSELKEELLEILRRG